MPSLFLRYLSERATKLALTTLRSYIADDALLVITIRPSEYWESVASTIPNIDPDSLVRLHNAGASFSFLTLGKRLKGRSLSAVHPSLSSGLPSTFQVGKWLDMIIC
jgi:hypothetical protein